MARILDRLCPNTLELLAEALDRVKAPSRTTSIRDELHNSGAPATRQAKNTRLTRALSVAATHAVILASQEPKFARLMFAPDFALLRLYSAETYAKFEYLLDLGHTGHSPGWQKLFVESADYVVQTAAGAALASRESLLIALNCVTIMFGGVILHGQVFAPLWRELWQQVRRRGVDDNPYFRMLLSLLGCHTGECEAYVRCLHDPQIQAFDMADLLCFVRHDRGNDLRDNLVALMRGRPVRLRDCLHPSQPASTLRHLFHYLRTCLRRPSHFYNEGLALGLLSWAEQATALIAQPEIAKLLGPAQLAALDKERRSFDRTRAMERGRFARIIEAVDADAPYKAELLELWGRFPCCPPRHQRL